jgi:acetyl esterase/lipase
MCEIAPGSSIHQPFRRLLVRPTSIASCVVFTLAAIAAHAQATPSPAPCTETALSNPFLGISTIRLWSGDAPEAKGDACDDIPTLSILRPQPGHENGSAVVVMPGGAYMGLAAILEGREVADWFAAHGFTAFVLRYRLGKKYLLPTPLIDARRAVQLVRARARDYHVDPNRIVAIGFSAGGHLAALSGTQSVPGTPDAEDPLDRVSSKPDYLVLGYPWIGAISPDTSHLSYCKLEDVMSRCEELQKAYSPVLFVTKDTQPTFIYHTTDDATVPVEQPLSFYEAELKAGVSVEMHIFATGKHGSGLGKGEPSLDQWPGLLETWLRAQGLLTVDPGLARH